MKNPEVNDNLSNNCLIAALSPSENFSIELSHDAIERDIVSCIYSLSGLFIAVGKREYKVSLRTAVVSNLFFLKTVLNCFWRVSSVDSLMYKIFAVVSKLTNPPFSITTFSKSCLSSR